ncbi:DUF2202 domain-containing protein [Myxococcota bacterium]|nr:DUF2202 domain-containing protein [Myxococcota bacterium]
MRKNAIYSLIIPISFALMACGSEADTGEINTQTELSDINENEETNNLPDDSESEELSDEIALDLQFLREEEKLARDVYVNLYEKWEFTVFNNISRSEQSHMDQVKIFLDTWEIEDPIGEDAGEDIAGVFKDEILAGLYLDLTTMGANSLTDALIVGMTIEDLDIKDILEMIENTENEEILKMYELLVCGSRNHMRSFYSNLQTEGGEYEPQFITSEDFEAIVTSQQESCAL